MIDLDLSDEKPIRQRPYHLSPANTLIAKELVGGFIEDGILKAATSDYWAFPIVMVPKPGTGKPGREKRMAAMHRSEEAKSIDIS